MGACVADSGDEGILITKNVAPGDGCVLTADPGEPFIGHGQMSTHIPTDYRFFAQMKSRITAADDQIDQRTVFTEGANVDLAFPDSTFFTAAELADMNTAGITHFKTLFTAPIAPNGGITDGSFMIVPEALFGRIQQKAPEATGDARFAIEVVATIQVTGTMAGDDIESSPYQFPITISNREVAHVVGACPLPEGTELLTGNGCMMPQDAPVTCCSQDDGAVICPAIVEQPPKP
jgi:hypothetical protein